MLRTVVVRDGPNLGREVEFTFEKRCFPESRFFGPQSVTGDTSWLGLLKTHRIAAKDISAQDYLDLCSLDPNFQQTFSS